MIENSSLIPRGEGMSLGVLYVTDVKRARMTFTTHNSTNTTQVPSSSNHAQITWWSKKITLNIFNISFQPCRQIITRIKSNGIQNLASGNIQMNSVVNFYNRIGISNCSTIMRN